MNVKITNPPRARRGSVLIIALVFFGIVALSTAGYLMLAHSRLVLRARNLAWSNAMPLAEAGIEEALTHLTDDTAPDANGWTAGTVGGQSVYTKQRNFTNGNYISMTIYRATTNNPYIYATGYLPAPLQSSGYVSRTVRVGCTNQPLINVAFGAVNSISMNGNGVAADSYNSGDPALSTNGQYDSSKTTTNGNVSTVNGPVSLGNHSIAGSLYLGTNASSSVSSGQVSGSINSNATVNFPDVVLPNTNWAQSLVTTINGKQVHDFAASGNYYVNDSSDILVEPGVTVSVVVSNAAFSPNNINILTNSSSGSGTLKLYQISGSGNVSGTVNVQSGRPRNFYYFGLPGVTSITYGGNATFIGVIYAPEADLTLNGGGNGSGLIGSSVTKTITMHGHFNFHFDEDLLTSGPFLPPKPTSWQEL